MTCATCKYEVANCSRSWWAYREVIFCRLQILFILGNLELLEEGKWPPDPVETGYTGGTGRKQAGNASFERPVSISGEVSKRLAQCAQIDGAMLYQTYVWEIQVEDIAKSFNCQVEEVERRTRLALAYITGWRRKRMEYGDWVKQRRHRNDTLQVVKRALTPKGE